MIDSNLFDFQNNFADISFPGQSKTPWSHDDDDTSRHQTAVGNGVTVAELKEVVTQLAFYAGWPAAATAARLLGELQLIDD